MWMSDRRVVVHPWRLAAAIAPEPAAVTHVVLDPHEHQPAVVLHVAGTATPSLAAAREDRSRTQRHPQLPARKASARALRITSFPARGSDAS